MSLVAELRWRGLVHQMSDPALEQVLVAGSESIYVGFDPTAESLHVGSLVPIIALMRAQRAGHRPIGVVGGATGMIGDPSGKSAERNLLDADQLARNVAGVHKQLERFLDLSGPCAAVLVDNYDWMKALPYLTFLRDVGKHFSVNMMLKRDSVAKRIEQEQGISYTEFSYMLLQAYDFLHLRRAHGCRVQLGGSDQWGNIASGIDFIRRMGAGDAYGLTMPLITTSSGGKFGKTEKGAIWLDAAKSSPYELYQFFLNTDDRDVGRFLRFYTFLDEPAIVALDETVKVAPEKREAQRVLAHEVTALVHGADEAKKAEDVTRSLFARGPEARLVAPPDAPSTTLPAEALAGGGMPIAELLVRTALCSSKGAARREIEGGGIYVNDIRVESADRTITAADLNDGVVLLRRGKKTYHVVRTQAG